MRDKKTKRKKFFYHKIDNFVVTKYIGRCVYRFSARCAICRFSQRWIYADRVIAHRHQNSRCMALHSLRKISTLYSLFHLLFNFEYSGKIHYFDNKYLKKKHNASEDKRSSCKSSFWMSLLGKVVMHVPVWGFQLNFGLFGFFFSLADG